MKPQARRILATLGIAGALVGGGAAIANAATGSSSGTTQSGTTVATTPAAPSAAPSPESGGNNAEDCPDM